MNINFYNNGLTADDFILLRNSTTWGVPPKTQIENSLNKSLYSVVAKDNDRTVGMGRLVGDGFMYWYIQDVIVLPEYQGKNIGRSIIENLLNYVKTNSLPENTVTVGLMAAKGKEGFYKKLGFIERPDDVLGCGMIQNIKIP